MLGVHSSVAAVGSVYCNGVVVEQPILGRYSHLVGNENVLEVGVIHKHTFAHGGDGIGHLEGDVCLSSGIDQQLSLIAVVEYAILRGKGEVAFIHLKLLQAGEILECVGDVVNVLHRGGEGNGLHLTHTGMVEQLGGQRCGGKAAEGVGDVPMGIGALVVADGNTVVIGEHIVPFRF